MYFFFNTTFESRYVSGRPKISSEGERNNNTQQFEYGRLQLTLTLMMPRFRSVSPGIFSISCRDPVTLFSPTFPSDAVRLF